MKTKLILSCHRWPRCRFRLVRHCRRTKGRKEEVLRRGRKGQERLRHRRIPAPAKPKDKMPEEWKYMAKGTCEKWAALKYRPTRKDKDRNGQKVRFLRSLRAAPKCRWTPRKHTRGVVAS